MPCMYTYHLLQNRYNHATWWCRKGISFIKVSAVLPAPVLRETRKRSEDLHKMSLDLLVFCQATVTTDGKIRFILAWLLGIKLHNLLSWISQQKEPLPGACLLRLQQPEPKRQSKAQRRSSCSIFDVECFGLAALFYERVDHFVPGRFSDNGVLILRVCRQLSKFRTIAV